MRITAKIAYTVRGTKRIYTNQSTQIQSTHLNGSNFANLSSLMLVNKNSTPVRFSLGEHSE